MSTPSSHDDKTHGEVTPAERARQLAEENAQLTLRLQEVEDTLHSIHRGDIDALVVNNDVYVLESARDTTNKLRKDVLAQMEDAVFAFDLDGHVTFMNSAAERQYGITSSDALGRLKTEVFIEQAVSEDLYLGSGFGALHPQADRSRVATHTLRDGTEIHVETVTSELTDASGTPVGSLAVIRDVGDRLKAERTLREADRQKDEFLATLAHELRNPLAPISNAIQIMRLSHDPAVHEKTRTIVERQLRQLVHLVDDLLDVSRISQGKVELRREALDMSIVIQTAIETSRPLIDAGGHELMVDLPPPGTLRVNGDMTRLCQIVSNLLNNAAKYTPDHGRIEISARRDGWHAVISVQDSGIGIAHDMLPRVFDMFTQVDDALDRSRGGLGIGLALVKRLVEMHGGVVQVHSDGANSGSRFTVRLPVLGAGGAEAGGDEHATDIAARRAQEARHAAGRLVLIVDDNIDSANSLSELLKLMGYSTLVTHDGLSAVQLAAQHRPAAAVLDIGLPVLSGHEAAQRIRAQPGGRELLLIALSGWGQDDDRRHSQQSGFDHHFVKPVDLEKLKRLLADAPRR